MIGNLSHGLQAMLAFSFLLLSNAHVVEMRATTTSKTSAAATPMITHVPAAGGFVFLGCYTEATKMRALNYTAFTDPAGMNVYECSYGCRGYEYLGVEYGQECYCGNQINKGSVPAPLSDCKFICPGDDTAYCGAGYRLEMYIYHTAYSSYQSSLSAASKTRKSTTTSSPTSKKGITTVTKSVSSKTSTVTVSRVSPSTTSKSSTATSKKTSTTTSKKTTTITSKKTTTTTSKKTTTITSRKTTTTTSITTNTSAKPLPTQYPTGWKSQGCYVDSTMRILNHQQPDNSKLTIESCIQTCSQKGYKIAGMEYSSQCFCDNYIYNGGVLAQQQSECNMPCSGNSTEICGGSNRLSLWSLGVPSVYSPPAPQTSGLPNNWKYKGCIQDNVIANERVPNPGNPQGNVIELSTFPYLAYQDNNNTAVRCISQCAQFGYNSAGLEYGSQCFCGDEENILVASNPSGVAGPKGPQAYTRSKVPQIVPDNQCNSPCTGNANYFCGSGNLLSYYSWSSKTPSYTWGMPTGAAAGKYSLLIGGVVVPLMTAQNVNGKVAFVEKYGYGQPNGTSVYELDLSLVSNAKQAWREMSGLQTSVFGATGLILPDKAGRQITLGGLTGQSSYGVRLYWPDGTAGHNGTNEWVEAPGVVSLQVPRYYPSAMQLANGSIMVIGGETSQNAAEQPTLELLPPTGVPNKNTVSGRSNTTVYLDFLAKSGPNNLTPFTAVTPTGIFVAYDNKARLLDEKTFKTIKILPDMPGAVNDPTGGRSYQLQGAMALLPQHAPYSDHLAVLVCGGSTPNGGYAIDNCVSTRPEDTNPTWTIERMPSRRVMPCIAGLPDGTYLILNGAQHGIAGYNLAENPNYNAVLYDPSKPVNSRMSIMANTTVARLNNNQAITLLDGRVLVSGSDPSGDYNAAEVAANNLWPEEYRVEVFTPPYLMNSPARPTFTIKNTDWAWGQANTFTITSGAATRVSLLGAVVSNHGNAMGQRTIFPAFSCSGSTCTVTAPPNGHQAPPGWYMMFVLNGATPSVGQFVRIGKDPAGLGNWPENVPGIQVPGI